MVKVIAEQNQCLHDMKSKLSAARVRTRTTETGEPEQMEIF
jgi:hypothetical protein